MLLPSAYRIRCRRLGAVCAVNGVLLGASLLTAPHASAQQIITAIDSVEVRSVEFEGNSAYGDRALAAAIATAPTRCTGLTPLCWLGLGVQHEFLDTRTLLVDVARLIQFYWDRGYREASAAFDTTRVEDGMAIRFSIQEGRPVRVASIVIDSAAGVPARVTRNLPLQVAAPLNMFAYEAARDSLITRMLNLGYASADVLAGYSIDTPTPLAADVQYELVPGPIARFGNIGVVGAEKVSPAVVQRLLTFRSGDLYSRKDVLDSQRNLFSQELFQHAEIIPTPSLASDTVVDVSVQVNEGQLRRVRVGVGLSTAEFVNLQGEWTSRSFLGGARRLAWRAQISNLLAPTLSDVPIFEASRDIYGHVAGTLSVDFTQPWFFGPLNTFGAGLYTERRSIPDVFVRTATGGYASFERSLGPGTSVNLAFRPERTRLQTADGDLIFCLGFTACGAEEIRVLRDPHILAPVALSFIRDLSNNIFSPSSGYVLRFDAEAAARFTGSDFGYTRIVADLTDYHAFGRFISAYRLRFGWAEPTGGNTTAFGVHPQKRFFAGGPNSVRGYAQYRLGPKVLTVDAADRLALPVDEGGAGCTAQEINSGDCSASALAAESPNIFQVQPVGGAILAEANFEVRLPLIANRFQPVAFVDAGQVWAERSDADLGNLTWTPGLGVRFFSAIGPIRIDVGYNSAGAERVNVVTTEVEHCPPDAECGPILDGVSYDYRELRNVNRLRPLDAVLWNPRLSFIDRLQMHFSIGQAF